MKIFSKLHLGSILLTIFLNIMVSAQNLTLQETLFKQIYAATEQEYGFDHELINGILFENTYVNSLGHPYLLDDNFHLGSVVFRGKLYPGLWLKYDIYDQQLLICFILNEKQVIFYLTKEFISEFNILNKKFIKLSLLGDEKERFYQILGKDFPIKILYDWKKIRSDSYHLVIKPDFKFSNNKKRSYILIHNNLTCFQSNRSFINIFPEQNQKLIKQYIHQNKIKVKYCSDNEMELLLEYFNSLNHTALN